MQSIKSKGLTSFFILALTILPVCGEVKLPAIIADNMVVQQGRDVTIWGWADPGEQVTVGGNWIDRAAKTKASDNGKWQIKIAAPPIGGPYTLTVKGDGQNTIKLKNILSGEVWICSGQSNMEWPLAAADNSKEEIAAADHPNIRLFTVTKKIAAEPMDDCTGQWNLCSPDTVPGFSAVGYFFGREIQKEMDMPVGLINSSWGGTPAESWTNAENLKKMPDYAPIIEQMENTKTNLPEMEKEYNDKLAQWQEKFTAMDQATRKEVDWTNPDSSVSDWKTMKLPQLWDNTELGNLDGAVLYRKVIHLPDAWKGKELTLELGPIDDEDITWFNGQRIGGLEGSGKWNIPRKYKVPGKLVKGAHNVIAVRALDTGGGGGFNGQAAQMKIAPTDDSSSTLSLAGDWKYKVGYDIKELPPRPAPPVMMNNPNMPTSLYNGMIAPVINFTLRGAIWYQGESNSGRAYQYRTLFPLMIQNWREDWGLGAFPFLFVQIAPYKGYGQAPTGPELQEAQFMTLSLPNTGMAVITDIGNINDIHPRNKLDVGKRLSLWALSKAYGRSLVHSGPLYKNMLAENGKIRLFFNHAGNKLIAKDGKLTDFIIAGADQNFVEANAIIDGNTILVSSDKIANPVAVRFAWTNNAEPNLFNQSGLPASPFRTDAWPGVTQPKPE